MIVNCDLCDVISEVEIIRFIKKDEWPENMATFHYLNNWGYNISVVDKLEGGLDRLIEIDVEYNNVTKIALWFAINFPNVDPHKFVDDLSLPLLYSNGFITDFSLTRMKCVLSSLKYRDLPPLKTLRIVTSHNPELFDFIYDMGCFAENNILITWVVFNDPAKAKLRKYFVKVPRPVKPELCKAPL